MDALVTKIEQLLPQKKINIFGTNSLMFNTFPYYLLAIIMAGSVYGNLNTGFIFMFIIYALLPLLDQFFSFDQRNPTRSERQKLLQNDIYFKLALYATVLLDWITFFQIMNVFAQIELTFLSLLNLAGFLFIFSNLQSVGFAVSHQIFHKNGIFDKLLGTFHMSKNLYMHFTYQHLFGHHRRVATPEDPATALKGQNVYSFFIKSFLGSYKSVYNMEKSIKKPFFMNYAVLSILGAILFTSLMFKVYGFQAGILFLLSAYGSIFYLQAINFIEHYGLLRQKLPNGQYEKVTIKHSWNAPHRFSNYLLFKLQRHSDHHQNSLKPYQTLESLDDSPHLPHGYSVIIFLSFFPRSWKKIMDPLVEEYEKVKTGNINSKVMAKSYKQVRKFIIDMGIKIMGLCIVSFMIPA